MQVENPKARRYYIRDAIGQNLSVRTLERQIGSHSYERLLKSRNREIVKSTITILHKSFDIIPLPYTTIAIVFRGECNGKTN